tara:strand:- start:2002 stop:2193 length:192 start_codon:yes stop_codon:yes gene_type:complete
MLAILLQAIATIESGGVRKTTVLTETHLKSMKRPSKSKKIIPRKNPRQWKGVYEHKDTPIHHH